MDRTTARRWGESSRVLSVLRDVALDRTAVASPQEQELSRRIQRLQDILLDIRNKDFEGLPVEPLYDDFRRGVAAIESLLATFGWPEALPS